MILGDFWLRSLSPRLQVASGLWCVLVSEPHAASTQQPERMAQQLQVESISVANVAARMEDLGGEKDRGKEMENVGNEWT